MHFIYIYIYIISIYTTIYTIYNVIKTAITYNICCPFIISIYI